MFDFDAGKLIIIGIVALIVIGPKELPGVLRQVGQAVGKMRRMAAEFQGQFMEAMREADIADIKADVAKLADSAKVDVDFNPVAELKNQITSAVDAPALAAPQAAGASLNAIDLPRLPEAQEEGGESLLAAGIAPAPVEAEEATEAPAHAEPVAAGGVEAEMQALATALEAEMRSPPRRADADESKARGSNVQDQA
ncbi:Sec-independent protein translocase protein TatB [Methylocapsa polymorpha]|uniref:Sec-independent protein translocase protein TatB n=1 Tax=Methylocapsa polymorpha TaxID=3080828 RepID=A0ABZ0HSI4_9HYPH|nr:Sec-independent protein translocase protein TatB [Methylocapsa sp. RX1]